ncbi:hypothetical protein BP6252_13823 [Coleophoma cylindrospora]|uniref:Uncharacterized protein n=1 Tax=Coleophoma cylindrospora TaxID=1849047 RepID=A0A3D8Q5Q1_9HELO|nr:hypothetical protein BP6252_13823 [Coleophoma cylindrospora]
MEKLVKDHELIDHVKCSAIEVPWCDEFEKMISGMNFDGSKSPVMQSYKLEVLRRLQNFNDQQIGDDTTLESLKIHRLTIAQSTLGKLGEECNIERPFFCSWGCNIVLGDGVYINRDVSIYDNAPVIIGDNVRIGPGVCICTGTHDVDPDVRRDNGGSFALPIRIEDDCWIGARVTILPGVTIGRGSTVAAGAVVTRDVEEYCLVGGVPVKLIKRLSK